MESLPSNDKSVKYLLYVIDFFTEYENIKKVKQF